MLEMIDPGPEAGSVPRAHHPGVQHDLLVRLADPYLTDRDRWILCQLAWFFSGIAPDARLQRVTLGPPQYLRVVSPARTV